MKLLAVADFHQNEELKDSVVAEANGNGYDLVMLVGDYEEPEYYTSLYEALEPQTLALTGNWDFGFDPPSNNEYERLFNFKTVQFGDMHIALLGSVYPDDYKDQVAEFFEGVPNEHRIIASHYPPHMLGDLARTGNRAGFPGFRDLLMRQKPALWLCGHIHEDYGRFSLLDTVVLNCAAKESGKGWAVELGEDGVETADEVEFLENPVDQRV